MNSGALVGGYRSTSIGLAGGRQYHDKLVLGLGARAPLPGFGSLPVRARARWAFETTTVLVDQGHDGVLLDVGNLINGDRHRIGLRESSGEPSRRSSALH